MAETLISLDESKKVARAELPEPRKATADPVRHIGLFVAGGIFLLALVLFFWIIFALLSSSGGLDTIFPSINSGDEARELRLD